jgi:flagellar hook protein FlgE
MRLESALYSSLSGLNVHGQAISVIGDNVSNANTTAYKTQRPEFSDLVSQATNASSPNVEGGGGGVAMSRIRTTSAQGVIEATGRPLDVAITGEGYFQVGSPTAETFTRNGIFAVNSAGLLVDSAAQPVLGYTGKGTTLGTINMTAVDLSGTATTTAGIVGNLDSSTPLTTAPTAPATFNEINKVASAVSSLDVFDSLGVRHTIALGFFKTGANAWTAQAYVDSSEVGGTAGVPKLIGSTTINFGNDGVIPAASQATTLIAATPAWSGGAATGKFDINLGGATQFGGANDIKNVAQDGSGIGKITDYQIDKDGKIYASLDTGVPALIGSIVLANFSNKDGLVRSGNSHYVAGSDTGTKTDAVPGSSGAGSLAGASLEYSTVDIAEQFVSLVIYQRGYQANSQALNVANQTLRDTIQLMK